MSGFYVAPSSDEDGYNYSPANGGGYLNQSGRSGRGGQGYRRGMLVEVTIIVEDAGIISTRLPQILSTRARIT